MRTKRPSRCRQMPFSTLDVAGLARPFAAGAVGVPGRPRRRPATSRCAWRGNRSPVGRRSRQGTRTVGRAVAHEGRRDLTSLPTRGDLPPGARWPWSPQSSGVRRVPARRLSRRAKACRSTAGDWRLFFETFGDGRPRHAEDVLGGPQTQPLDSARP